MAGTSFRLRCVLVFFKIEKESCPWYSKIFQSYQETIVLKMKLDKSLLLSFADFCSPNHAESRWLQSYEVWAYSYWRTRDCTLLPEIMGRIKLVGCSRHLIFTEVSGFHSFKADSNFIRSTLIKTCLSLGFQKMVKTIKCQNRQYRKKSFELSVNFSRN